MRCRTTMLPGRREWRVLHLGKGRVAKPSGQLRHLGAIEDVLRLRRQTAPNGSAMGVCRSRGPEGLSVSLGRYASHREDGMLVSMGNEGGNLSRGRISCGSLWTEGYGWQRR